MALIELLEARRTVLESVQALSAETVPLQQALGRVLAEDVEAVAPVPAFDASAMDGFAVRAGDVTAACEATPVKLEVVAESRAGHPTTVMLARDEAIAISTGAMLPNGADAVVPVEQTRSVNGSVEVCVPVQEGNDVRYAGEDVQAGETVLRRGEQLRPAALGVLASLGRSDACCARRPRVGLLLTGDELIGPSDAQRPGTVRDSNSYTLTALIRCCGAELASVGRVGDDAQATLSLLRSSLAGVDALVICGGMSVGAYDHVRPSLHAIGAKQAFWGLALKPGKPTWFGTVDGVPVFGLPGNPVSALVTFTLLVAPALNAMQGEDPDHFSATATLDVDYEKAAGRAHALRCRLMGSDTGWHAELTGLQGSHVLTSLLRADALLLVASETTFVPAGSRLPVELLPMQRVLR